MLRRSSTTWRRHPWADVAIARAGAGTIAELALAGLPSLLVPLADAAEDHQALNALAFSAHGAAFTIREQDWDASRAAGLLAPLLRSHEQWTTMSQAARSLGCARCGRANRARLRRGDGRPMVIYFALFVTALVSALVITPQVVRSCERAGLLDRAARRTTRGSHLRFADIRHQRNT